MSEVFIGRQPILDKNMKLFAYELEFHQGLSPIEDRINATTELIAKTEQEIGFKSIVGNNTAMISFPKELIGTDVINVLDLPSNIVLEIPNDILKDKKTLSALKEVKSEGTSIALENFVDDESSIKLANISDFAKIDNEIYTEIKLKQMISQLHEKNIKVIAERVETEEMFNYLKAIGFDYFKGHFFTNPVIINGNKLSANKLSLLQLMSKINDSKTDFYELNQIISLDVALSHKLLLAVNNPMSMIPIRVESISDALRYMGLKRLKFWINMLLLSQIDDVPKELMISALIRARFCELMAETSGHKVDKDSYFLVGLFSALGAFFKSPIDQIVAEMPLSENVASALLNKQGLMGEALTCLQQIESTSTEYQELDFQGLNFGEIANIYLSSSAWAQQAVIE